MNLVFIPPENIDDVWVLAEREIVRAISASGNRTTPEEQKALFKNEERQLWLVWNDTLRAIVTTKVFKGVCTIELCAGHDMGAWLHLLSDVENWARGLGCREVELWGRAGWASKLPGYKRRAILLTKRLSGGVEARLGASS